MKAYQSEIRDIALSRCITNLFHFTPAVNAESILVNGLSSQAVLKEAGVDFFATDGWRLDGHLDALSLSIHGINHSMLAAKRKLYGGDWVIFALNASILWTHACRFCWSNASSREIKRHRGFLGGPWAFEQMFNDRPVNFVDRSSFRQARDLDDSQPTDHAAEVQVYDPISPDLILGVIVENERVKAVFEQHMPELDRVRPVKVMPDIFR